jgi:deoxyribonuclease V
MRAWPTTAAELVALQLDLARAIPVRWRPDGSARLAGCFVCFPRGPSGPGAPGDPGWAAAAIPGGAHAVVSGAAGAAYEAALLALREGPLLEAAVRALGDRADLLLVNGTGRDHPRRAGLALHLGAVLDLPTVGVTHRPLLAAGEWPVDERGATAPLRLERDLVGYWVRTRAGTRPLAAHAAWRTDADTAAAMILLACARSRTPEPLREARRLARLARAGAAVTEGPGTRRRRRGSPRR